MGAAQARFFKKTNGIQGPLALGGCGQRPRKTKSPDDSCQNENCWWLRHQPKSALTRLVRQQRLNYRPLEIRQIVTHDHAPTIWKLESHPRPFGNPFYEYVA